MSSSLQHHTLNLTNSLSLHALLRPYGTDPLISIREIDMKLLRSGGGGSKRKSVTGSSSASAQLNEQAARVKARQLMLSYATHLIEASKDEIRWLKDVAVLGKRAPKSSLMSASFLISLLKEQGKATMAAHLQNALVAAKVGKWKTGTTVAISAEDAAEAAMEAEEDDEDEEMEDEDDGEAAAASSSSAHREPRVKRRVNTSSKRKSDRAGGDDDDEDDEDDAAQQRNRKKSKRASGASYTPTFANSEDSPAMTILSSPTISPTDPLSPRTRPIPPRMQSSKASLLLNPRDQGLVVPRTGVHFGMDRTAGLKISNEDPCTIVGPYRGSASARASHGITQGSWYVEVRGTETAAQCMRDAETEANAANATKNATASAEVFDQDTPSSCRIGFATASCLLDTKLLGHDAWSYAYGDRYGDKIHEGEATEYGSSFAIYQMDAADEKQIQPLKPFDTIGMLIELGVPTRQASSGSVRSANTLDSVSQSSPSGTQSPSGNASSLNTGNRLSFYKNGVMQGVAWTDLPSGQTWFPAVSLINGMAVTFSFQVNVAAKPQATGNGGNGIPTPSAASASPEDLSSRSYPQAASSSSAMQQQQQHHHRLSNGSSSGSLNYASQSDGLLNIRHPHPEYPSQQQQQHVSSSFSNRPHTTNLLHQLAAPGLSQLHSPNNYLPSVLTSPGQLMMSPGSITSAMASPPAGMRTPQQQQQRVQIENERKQQTHYQQQRSPQQHPSPIYISNGGGVHNNSSHHQSSHHITHSPTISSHNNHTLPASAQQPQATHHGIPLLRRRSSGSSNSNLARLGDSSPRIYQQHGSGGGLPPTGEFSNQNLYASGLAMPRQLRVPSVDYESNGGLALSMQASPLPSASPSPAFPHLQPFSSPAPSPAPLVQQNSLNNGYVNLSNPPTPLPMMDGNEQPY